MDLKFYDLLLEAGNLINNAKNAEEIFEIIVEYANSAMKPDLICFYRNDSKRAYNIKLKIKKGFISAPGVLKKKSELIMFLLESGELVCLNTRKHSPFEELLLADSMESGLAIPLSIGQTEFGVLIVNSKHPYFFKHKEISFLENLSSITNRKNPGWRLK